MIEKEDFYHGAAIIKLFEDNRFISIKKGDQGFVINDDIFIFLKYRTKARSPWVFSFDDEDIKLLKGNAESFPKIIIIFICGGDGICPIRGKDLEYLLDNNPGWVSIRRKYNEQYRVSGSVKSLKRKISMRYWPSIAFD